MTIDPKRLRVSVTEGERWRRNLAVTVPADIVARERARVMSGISRSARIPGFRKGRVPASVLERHYGETAETKTLEKVLNEAVRTAIESAELAAISVPGLDDVRNEADGGLSFEISFDVRPEIEIARSGGFVVERPAFVVEEANVAAHLLRLRQEAGVWRPLEDGTPEAGNQVEVSILRLDREGAEARDYTFVLGDAAAIPDVERAIERLAVGAEGDFAVRFPDDFHDENRRGEEERLRIRLLGRKVLVLPEPDDDFAATLDFESLADLENGIRARLEQAAGRRAEDAVRMRLMESVLEANAFDVPDSMVERWLEKAAADLAEDADSERVEEMKAALRPRAEREIRIQLAMESLARANGLEATPEEVEERISEIARINGVGTTVARAGLDRESLKSDIAAEKVFEFLKQQSEIIEAD